MEQCSKVINDAIQLIQERSDDDAMMTMLQANYAKFKEQLNEIRSYIDEIARNQQDKKQWVILLL